MSAKTQTASPFTTVPKREFGYHTGQVDEFIEAARDAYETESGLSAEIVQAKTFDLVRGGYRTDQVDQVLERLEDALRRAERDEYIGRYGQQAWDLQLIDRLEELNGRLERPRGEKFRPADAGVQGYNVDDVEVCMARITGHLQDEEHIRIEDVRNATFRAEKGPHGYDEAQVDAFLLAVVELLVVLD
ncbi:MAG TPA: DivIVA domain-containing protein [Enteractinococcus sp.]